MPSIAQSPARSSRRNVTEVLAHFDAAMIEAVCKAGQVVALHVATRGGRYIFAVPLRNFVQLCRGAVDSNLSPFPRIEDLEATGPTTVEFEEIKVDAVARAEIDGCRMSDTQREKFVRTLNAYRKGTFRTKREACAFYGIADCYQAFVQWSTRQAAPQTDGARPFQYKPGGHVI